MAYPNLTDIINTDINCENCIFLVSARTREERFYNYSCLYNKNPSKHMQKHELIQFEHKILDEALHFRCDMHKLGKGIHISPTNFSSSLMDHTRNAEVNTLLTMCPSLMKPYEKYLRQP